MSGLVRVLDTLLAPNVSPPQTVGSVDGDSSVAAPGAVSTVQKVANDVRLLSNAAVERQLGGVDSALTRGTKGLGSPTGAALPASAVARLSFAARIISAVLADLEVDVGPVRGQGPVSATAQLPAGPALAGSLAHAVSNSGLFYESHLVEFTQGQRTLAQMAQEPQADFPAPGVVGSARSALAAVIVSVAGEGADAAPGAATTNPAPSAQLAVVVAGVPVVASATAAQLAATVAAPFAAAPATGSPHGVSAVDGEAVPAQSAAVDGQPADATPEALKMQAAYRWGPTATTVPAAEHARLRAADSADSAPRSAAPAAAAPSGNGDVVHPQLVTLVHQQLDLLATAAFRWSGEGWPGVPMDWSIHDEEAGRHAAESDAVETERRWSTRLSLQLPVLGTVDVRLSVSGSDVRATVVAPTEGTRARLTADGRALAARFDAAHLRLEQFQVAEGATA